MTLKTGILFFFFGWGCSLTVFSQNLNLQLSATSPEDSDVLETIEYPKIYKDFNSLQLSAQNIQHTLTKLGYLESDLLSLNKQNDSLYIAGYKVGPMYQTARIYYPSFLNKKLIKAVSVNIKDTYFEIDLASLETSLETINSEIANSGDPFASLQLTNVTKKDGMLLAHLEVVQQQKRTIDSIIIKGYDKFPKAFVKRYLKLKKHQIFNLKNIKEKTEALENLQFASQLKDPEVLFTKDSTLLYLYVEKQKSNTFDGFLGFGTNATTNKLEFDGYLNLNLVNNFNYGESFRLLYKSDESEQKTFDVNAKLSYLLGSPLGTEVGLNIFKRDSSYITTSQFAAIDYQINHQNTVSVGIDVKTSSNLLDRPSVFIEDFSATFYNVRYSYKRTTLYDQLFPVNFLFTTGAGWGSRHIGEQSTAQTQVSLETYKIFNLNLRNSIYTKLEAAMLNSDSYVENELFRFGGINSIRGFEENSLTANLFAVLNTEYRYKVTNTLYVNSIIDLAYYENNLLDLRSKLYGIGFGLGVLTKAGLLKLNYSNGSMENQAIKLSNSKIHISLSATF